MHFLGRKSYAELPAYCRQFDVGLIPFKLNELTRAVNPIKLREYLAAGLPVISTPLPEVAIYEQMVNLADTPEEFVRRRGRRAERPGHRPPCRSRIVHGSRNLASQAVQITNNLKASTIASRTPASLTTDN